MLGGACLEGCLDDSVFAAGTLPSSFQQLQAAQLKHRTTSKLMLTFPTQIPDGRLGVSSLITPSSSSPHPTPILDGTNRGTGIFHQRFLWCFFISTRLTTPVFDVMGKSLVSLYNDLSHLFPIFPSLDYGTVMRGGGS